MFGIDDLIGGVIGGVTNMASTAATNQASMDRQLQAQGYNTAATQEQQQFNASEAQKARDFNASQSGITRDYNAQQASIGRDFSSAQQLQAEQFNQREAETNRQYQTYMSDTAYERSMASMKAAGLNPILAYQQGGASTPSGGQASVGAVSGPSASSGAASGPSASGSSASSPSPPGVQSYANVFSSALEAMKAKPQIESLKAVADNQRDQNEGIRADNLNKEKQQDILNAQERNIDADTELKKTQKDTAYESRSRFNLMGGSFDPSYYASKLEPAVTAAGHAASQGWSWVNNSAKSLWHMVNPD
ncbi:MAG: DNA pilot protein [Microvirus sp.]|nr:MAG: DNA pilot protein [Microvirus sp.]